MTETASRSAAWLSSALVVIAVATPGFLPREWDSFPLSNYPMFSKVRNRVETLPRALSVHKDGTQHVLSPRVFGTDNTMQAISMLSRAVRQGDQALQALCRQLARHPDLQDPTSFIEEVQIVLATYDVLQVFESAAPAIAQQTLTRCQVQQERSP
jgi:hypothetical protein